MKSALLLAACAAFVSMLLAQTPLAPPGDQPAAKLTSAVYDWEKMPVTPTAKGERRDKAHCHITTLNPGEHSGEPRRHLQEEIIIVKEGLVEMHIAGETQAAGQGSVFFLAARATTALRNAGPPPPPTLSSITPPR